MSANELGLKKRNTSQEERRKNQVRETKRIEDIHLKRSDQDHPVGHQVKRSMVQFLYLLILSVSHSSRKSPFITHA